MSLSPDGVETMGGPTVQGINENRNEVGTCNQSFAFKKLSLILEIEKQKSIEIAFSMKDRL